MHGQHGPGGWGASGRPGGSGSVTGRGPSFNLGEITWAAFLRRHTRVVGYARIARAPCRERVGQAGRFRERHGAWALVQPRRDYLGGLFAPPHKGGGVCTGSTGPEGGALRAGRAVPGASRGVGPRSTSARLLGRPFCAATQEWWGMHGSQERRVGSASGRPGGSGSVTGRGPSFNLGEITWAAFLRRHTRVGGYARAARARRVGRFGQAGRFRERHGAWAPVQPRRDYLGGLFAPPHKSGGVCTDRKSAV